MHQDLKDMLYAWVVARSDEGLGYVRLFFPLRCFGHRNINDVMPTPLARSEGPPMLRLCSF